MAKKLPLDNLGLDELLALREDIDSRLKKMVATEMEALEKRMVKLAEITQTPPPDFSISLDKKTSAKNGKAPSKRKGKKAPIKFRDPETGNSWSGRGLTPVWLRNYESDGGDRADLEV